MSGQGRVDLAGATARFWRPIEARIAEVLSGEGLLESAARYHMDTGGKRLRALIPVWACVNLGGRVEDALDLGVGIELLHNATLVHDDLQDGDRVRRGQPAVWVRWGAPQAINVGNALFFHGIGTITKAPRGGALLAEVSRAMLAVIGGQAAEFELQLPADDPGHVPPTLDRWWRMARGKTAALFALSARAGAVAAEVSEERCEAAAGYGEVVGRLFQVQDDLLDLVGDKGRDLRGSDLAEGKLSFPVVWAYEHAAAAEVARLRAIVTAPRAATTPAMVREGIALLEGTGALGATAQWLRDAAAEATRLPWSRVFPGLVERVLAPVAHAL